jgi:hypothetical protein
MASIELRYKPVVITQFDPKERKFIKEVPADASDTEDLPLQPGEDKKPHYETFKLDAEPTDRVLDLLEYIKGYHDGTLSFRAPAPTVCAARTPCASTGAITWRAKCW